MAVQGFSGREHSYYDLSSNNDESYLQSFYDLFVGLMKCFQQDQNRQKKAVS